MTTSTIHVRVTRRFDASAERVFDAWLDPAKVAKWFAPQLGPMVRVAIDARVGGRFSFCQRRGADDVDHVGEYLELDRPRRLVFTWAMADAPDDASRVSIDIAPSGSGCELTLVHEMDSKWKDYASRTESGWKSLLDGIATVT